MNFAPIGFEPRAIGTHPRWPTVSVRAGFGGFQSLAERPVPLRTSPLGQFETNLTIRRQESDGRLDTQTADFWADELLVDLASDVIEIVASDFDIHAEFQHVLQTCLRHSPPILLRTLDALHLAAACTSTKPNWFRMTCANEPLPSHWR